MSRSNTSKQRLIIIAERLSAIGWIERLISFSFPKLVGPTNRLDSLDAFPLSGNFVLPTRIRCASTLKPQGLTHYEIASCEERYSSVVSSILQSVHEQKDGVTAPMRDHIINVQNLHLQWATLRLKRYRHLVSRPRLIRWGHAH